MLPPFHAGAGAWRSNGWKSVIARTKVDIHENARNLAALLLIVSLAVLAAALLLPVASKGTTLRMVRLIFQPSKRFIPSALAQPVRFRPARCLVRPAPLEFP